MGAFLYFDKSKSSDHGNSAKEHECSLDSMTSKGLVCQAILKRKQFDIYVYGKLRVETDNVLEFDGGDFIVATGTMIYKSLMGGAALQRIYKDFCSNDLSFNNFYGHFAVWIYRAGSLTLFNDFRGMYQVYVNEDRSVISNVFLPVYASLTKRTPNSQEIFEYLTYTNHFGERTILREIRILDPSVIHAICGASSGSKKKISIDLLDEDCSFQDHARFAYESLSEYFSVLAANFGDQQSIGLTGGYDSRLTLAYMRQAGVRPIVYVQGPPESIDVRVAKSIAKGEGFEILYSADEARPEFEPDEFPDRVRSAYLYLNGIPHVGLFSDMAMVSDDRRRRVREEALRLYGMGGETYRCFRHLSNRRHSMSEFMTSEYDKFENFVYGARFQKGMFLKNIANKIGRALNLDEETIGRVDAELAYPHFSLCRGAGPQMTLQNERAFSLVPYSEPIFTFASAKVPLNYKYLGRFEAELIRLADPRLAGYQSAYGFPFSDAPTLKARLTEKAKQLTPISVRPFLHRQKARMKQSKELPFYLQREYLREIFPDGFPNIEPFVNIDKITDHKMLSRAYTVELILSGNYCGTGSS